MISNVQIMTWIGINPAAVRNALIADFLSDGLIGLKDLTQDDVKETFASYSKRTDGPFPIPLTVLHKKRLWGLVLVVKDILRSQNEVAFNDEFERESFLQELSEAISRDDLRSQMQKIGESFIDSSFTHKLKGQAEWKKFMEELSSNLSMIVGVQGVPLTYVIRDDVVPYFDPDAPYDDAIIQGCLMSGPAFKIDAHTVHQIIHRNVHEDSDAYTYLKPLLRRHDGSLDIKALRDRYESDASRQSIINLAKPTLKRLRYKNEMSFSFERFSAKLQRAYDDLEECGRAVHNGDIVDALWAKIQDGDLTSYLGSLKVDYQRNPRNYKLILQDVASEVAMKRRSIEIKSNENKERIASEVYARYGPCPDKGVHTSHGSLYIGNYDVEKWSHESVKPYHKHILEARKKLSKKRRNHQQTMGVKKQKLEKLQKEIKAAKIKLKELSISKDGNKGGKGEGGDKSNAGDAFGGKSSKK